MLLPVPSIGAEKGRVAKAEIFHLQHQQHELFDFRIVGHGVIEGPRSGLRLIDRLDVFKA
jgi:hypothetical protein